MIHGKHEIIEIMNDSHIKYGEDPQQNLLHTSHRK